VAALLDALRPVGRRRAALEATAGNLWLHPGHYAIVRQSGRMRWAEPGERPKPGEAMIRSGDPWSVARLEHVLALAEREANAGR